MTRPQVSFSVRWQKAMSQVTVDTDHIISLLLKDSVPTLGARARSEVLRLAVNYEELARAWMAAGDSLAEAQRSFDRSVVDGLQEAAHDLFWDTTWPACPRHPHHPLWYDEDRQAWYCRQDQSVVAPLGGLAGLT
jgi:hypothetical protein